MMNLKGMTCALGVLFLVSSCTDGEIEEVNSGTEITFNTRVSRASVATTGNLTEFRVWAEADNYPSMIIDGEIATKKAGQSFFSLDRAPVWPPEVHSIKFWAVAPTDIKADVTVTSQSIKGFKPDVDITKQVDLITAYKLQQRSEGTTGISLKFDHALSQIVVRAKEAGGDNETKRIKIKGAWIVNVRPQGDLAKTGAETENNLLWSVDKNVDKVMYGTTFARPVELGHVLNPLLDYSEGSAAASFNMMLVPQKLDQWNISDDNQKETNPIGGAYILLLCRVEAVHSGGVHEGATTNEPVRPSDDKKSHIHQMFPFTNAFDEYEYGYTCVPIDTEWEPGKKYVYNLDFCGGSAGAGIYPPDGSLTAMPESETNGDYTYTYVKDRPADKKAGDPVLDSPIVFNVSVTDWDDVPWTNGTQAEETSEASGD